jgi:serine/threonine protein kinase/tetratricopeptide (TPR) repeat protein
MEQRKLFDGRYRLVRPLGRGAVGQLWLARDTWSSGVQVALKRPAQPASATAGPTLESEFRILREARHPHIATAYDFGRLPDGACYFTLEYVAGPDIGTASRRVPLKVLIDRLIETCLALAAVHAAGYVHGDVKPANILVSRVGAPAVKLVDFGHAVPRGHQGLRLRGTPGLIAPEVATGARVDAVTDLFSLGGTITRLLASRPSRESEGVAELARRLAAPRPQDRPESALAAAAALEAARPRDRAARRGATLVADLALAPPQVPLIGRDPQLRQLNALLGTTIEHACLSLAVVTGTPGAGKTRLLDAFRTIGQLRGCLAISLTCARAGEPASAGEPHPSKTISQLLERLVLALPPDAESLARCGPELLKLAPHLRDWQAFGAAGSREAQPEPAGRPLPPKQEQARQRDRLAWFVAQQARRRPLVLELRDVQQAGPDIQDLVRALASGADSSPILIILAVDAPRSEARSWIRDLAVRSRLDLSLPGLSPGATRRFVNVLLRSRAWNAAPPSRALVRAIHERTGGLPGQVVELTRAILASGGLRRWDCPEAIQVLPMPRELDEILAQRLGHVGPSERTLLELLAHADPPVGPGLLEYAWRRLVGRGARSPGPPLLHLAQNRLLTRSEQTSVEAWEFADPRFAAVLRSRCPAARSRRMHRALADALADAARRTPRGAAVRVQLDAQRAGHCLAGGDDEAAVLLARRAAAGLKVRHGYREALALLRRALPAVARWARRDPAHAGRLEVEILLEAAELALLLGDVAQEQTLIAKLYTRARRARLSALECARLERRQGVLAMLAGRHSRSAPHFNRAERSLAKPARGTSAVDVLRERLRLVASRAMLHVHQGSAPRALEICTSALAPFSKTTPGGRRRNRRAAAVGPEIASLLNWRAIALIYSGEPEQAVASWEEASAAYHAADGGCRAAPRAGRRRRCCRLAQQPRNRRDHGRAPPQGQKPSQRGSPAALAYGRPFRRSARPGQSRRSRPAVRALCAGDRCARASAGLHAGGWSRTPGPRAAQLARRRAPGRGPDDLGRPAGPARSRRRC